MDYNAKLTFHIPCAAWSNGLIEINYKAFKQYLLEGLAAIGLTSLYSVQAKGYYKGREYDEILLTVFCKEQDCDAAAEVFRQTFRVHNDLMRQEAFAYECNGVLVVENL